MSREGSLHAVLLGRPAKYDGTQIGPLWAYRVHGIQGDSLVAFRGPCAIPARHMIDQEDVRRRAKIASPDMLHFLAEHFDAPVDLEKAVLRQRLFASTVHVEVARRSRQAVLRDGDDLFTLDGRKLSISIATATAVSSKFHFGINVREARGVGVKTAGLRDLGIDAPELALAVLGAYRREIAGVLDSRTRARGAM